MRISSDIDIDIINIHIYSYDIIWCNGIHSKQWILGLVIRENLQETCHVFLKDLVHGLSHYGTKGFFVSQHDVGYTKDNDIIWWHEKTIKIYEISFMYIYNYKYIIVIFHCYNDADFFSWYIDAEPPMLPAWAQLWYRVCDVETPGINSGHRESSSQGGMEINQQSLP